MKNTPRIVWVDPDDVDGPLTEDRIVRLTRPVGDFALRSQDGSEPIPAGTAVEIAETRPYGKAIAHECSDAQGELLDAALDLQADGLFEVGTVEPGPEREPALRNGDRVWLFASGHPPTLATVQQIDGNRVTVSDGAGWCDTVDRDRIVRAELTARMTCPDCEQPMKRDDMDLLCCPTCTDMPATEYNAMLAKRRII